VPAVRRSRARTPEPGKRWSRYDLEVPVAAFEFDLDALGGD
jgi:hypothetical protein